MFELFFVEFHWFKDVCKTATCYQNCPYFIAWVSTSWTRIQQQKKSDWWQYVHWYHHGFTFCPWLPQVPWPKGTWSWNDKRCIGKLQAGKKEIFWRSTIKSPICWKNIDIVNTQIWQTLSMIENLKKSSDEIGFLAEKRTTLG